MSTPKTPMERAKELYEFTTNESGQNISEYCIDAYEQGDADRERIMREEASRGFEEYSTKEEHASWFSSVMNKQAGRHCWAAARADRQELVDCVLDLAQITESIRGKSVSFRAYDILDKYIGKHADLIAKLKAEKDTP